MRNHSRTCIPELNNCDWKYCDWRIGDECVSQEPCDVAPCPEPPIKRTTSSMSFEVGEDITKEGYSDALKPL